MIEYQPKYRVVYGFKADDSIIIDKDELEKLHYAQHLGASISFVERLLLC